MNLNAAGKSTWKLHRWVSSISFWAAFIPPFGSKDDQTDRYIAALRNPAIQMLGHPRGRIYNFGLGLNADWAHVFCGRRRAGQGSRDQFLSDRQDMSIDLIRLARKAGCRISIGTDSHGPSQLEFIEFALAVALKAKIDPDRILNFMSRERMMEWAASQRDRDSGRSPLKC